MSTPETTAAELLEHAHWIEKQRAFVDIGNVCQTIGAALRELAALKAQQPHDAFARECADIDKILVKPGIPLEKARTKAGNLHLPRIMNHIQETLDALVDAHNAAVNLATRAIKAQQPSGAQAGLVGMLEKALRDIAFETHDTNSLYLAEKALGSIAEYDASLLPGELSDNEIAKLAWKAGWDIRWEDYDGDEETDEPHLWDDNGDDSIDTMLRFARALLGHPSPPSCQ